MINGLTLIECCVYALHQTHTGNEIGDHEHCDKVWERVVGVVGKGGRPVIKTSGVRLLTSYSLGS